MEIISIEKRVFDSMLSRLETIAGKVVTLCGGNGKQLKEWLDNQDVCRILGINKRTLQAYRDKNMIPYSRFGHKTYYKPEDVERLLVASQQKKEPHEK